MCDTVTYKNQALYVHIPFCQCICAYCDFTRVRYNEKLAEQYLDTLQTELQERVDRTDFQSVYIGGGTPTALSLIQLERLLDMLKPYCTQAVEITIEANPEAITQPLIDVLKRGGINRISLGLQSCNDRMLTFLHRRHTFARAKQSVRLLQENGLGNISCDLIYSLPHQDLELWHQTLQGLIELDVPHCSLYSLTIEENSEFGRTGQKPQDEETEAQMYFDAVQVLKEAGYLHYEVSNFAKPGNESVHNRHYWHYDDFWGIGLGASGKLGSYRYDNTANFQEYFRHHWIGEKIDLSVEEQKFEMIMMNLRTSTGLDLDYFRDTYHEDLLDCYPEAVKSTMDKGWLVIEEGYLHTTETGMALLNTVLEEFLD